MDKHTPLPWKVGPNNEIRAGGRYNVCPTVTAGGSAKGMLDEREVIRANAAFIVKAVNNHDALVRALRALYGSYKQLADSGDAGNWSIEDTDEGKQALAALAAVEA